MINEAKQLYQDYSVTTEVALVEFYSVEEDAKALNVKCTQLITEVDRLLIFYKRERSELSTEGQILEERINSSNLAEKERTELSNRVFDLKDAYTVLGKQVEKLSASPRQMC